MAMQLIEQNKPWYSFPLVWMMIFIPFSAVIMGVVMIWLAVDTNDGLVVDDYYKQGLEINRLISRDKKAAELELKATVDFDNSAKLIKLQFKKGQLVSYPDKLQLNLQHATRANSDIAVVLDHGIDDQYIGRVNKTLTEGIWYFVLLDQDWKLTARTRIGMKNTIELSSGY
jgi:hypothetical protein